MMTKSDQTAKSAFMGGFQKCRNVRGHTISFAEIGRMSGVCSQAISSWTAYKRKETCAPSLYRIMEIAYSLGVSMDDICDFDRFCKTMDETEKGEKDI